VEAPQVQAWVKVLTESPDTIDDTAWEEVIRFIERSFESDDAIALLQT
jgi:rRNA processing protein Krr1/Pno1